jgi:APA family basic amino acid/polyamine antiporter
MARAGDLPAPLAAVHPRHRVPHRAEVAVAVAVSVLVLLADLREAIGFSAFGVLVYYLVANAAALTQERSHRRYPRALPAFGVVGCLVLALAVPLTSLLAGALALLVGVAYRLWRVGRPG